MKLQGKVLKRGEENAWEGGGRIFCVFIYMGASIKSATVPCHPVENKEFHELRIICRSFVILALLGNAIFSMHCIQALLSIALSK